LRVSVFSSPSPEALIGITVSETAIEATLLGALGIVFWLVHACFPRFLHIPHSPFQAFWPVYPSLWDEKQAPFLFLPLPLIVVSQSFTLIDPGRLFSPRKIFSYFMYLPRGLSDVHRTAPFPELPESYVRRRVFLGALLAVLWLLPPELMVFLGRQGLVKNC